MVSEGAKFCPECGTPIKTIPTCKGCGLELSLLAKFCSECGTANADLSEQTTHVRPSERLDKFEFIQRNRVVSPVSGVVHLAADEFIIRYFGVRQRAAVLASSSENVKRQVSSMINPALSITGTGAAYSAGSLGVQEGPLKLYETWTSWHEHWGRTYPSVDVSKMSQTVPSPSFLMSGRDSGNFSKQTDGSLSFLVAKIDEKPVSVISGLELSLLLTADDFNFAVSKYDPFFFDWEFICLRFQ
jgi:hypothetical protein